jgi:hypothetical protein
VEKREYRRRGHVLRGGTALGLLCLLAHAPATAAPKLAVPKTEVTVGALIAGETAAAEFAIENRGTEPLKITHVATSCGCTTTSYPRTLAPGEKGVLKAKLASNPLWSGRVQKEITVTSNDPAQPTRKLHLVAEMRPLFQFSPVNPLVVRYRKGDVIRQVVTLSAAPDLPGVKVLGLGTTTAETEARILPARASDAPGTARVEVIVHPPTQGGDITGQVMLQTSHPRVPTVPLMISLLCQDAITVQPRAVYWAAPGAGPSPDSTRLITLMKRSGPFRVLAAKAEHPALQVEIDRADDEDAPPRSLPSAAAGRHQERNQDGSRSRVATYRLGAGKGDSYHEITLRCAGSLPKGTTRGKLVITTDDPESPRLEIPYQLMVR